jgi:hypothetical protein
MMATALFMSMMMLAGGVPRAGFATETTQMSGFQEREEINESYQLTPGARVEISNIRGGVEIVNTDSTTAEVQIVRTARTRADLAYHKIEVEHTGRKLVVKGITESEQRQTDNPVNHHVILKLPRRIDLSVNKVNGPLKVGDVDGLLDVSKVNGFLTANLAGVSPQGINIEGVKGTVEIGFKSEVNADVNVTKILGQIHLNVPNVNQNFHSPHSVRARVGAGGAPITISKVVGDIRLTRS